MSQPHIFKNGWKSSPTTAIEVMMRYGTIAFLSLLGLQGTRETVIADSDLEQPPEPVPATMDADEVGWASVRNLTSKAFTADFNARKDDYLLLDIEVNNVNSKERVSGVWQKNLEGRQWAAYRNMTSGLFNERWNAYNEAGYRLIDQESYALGDDRYYAGIWIENLEEYTWASYRNLTSSQFADYSESLGDTHALIDFEAYTMGDSIRYAGAWVENAGATDWLLLRDRTAAEFEADCATYQELYRIHDVESYQVSGGQRYAAIWIRNTNGRKWQENSDMDDKDYRNRWLRYRDLGYRLTDFEQYETSEGMRYAGVWRQNSDRPDWPLRPTIDDIASAHLEENDIPGMGIAIVNQGKIEYMRGFGHQDLANDDWYSAHTINRLASVSKAIAGVLLFKLDDQDQISPSTTTSRYIPGLPSHHTHTLAQLASNRGGIGHYDELGLGTLYTQYDTALEASALFWDAPLTVTPGAAYNYSTHGYTLLGAAIEGAAGAPIADVLDNLLGNGLGLPTLRAENRSEDSDFRSVLYHTDNSPATPDNISWKVLGGGIESSSYDLARFAAMLMSGQILSSESLEQMWTVPDPDNVAYAMGWNIGITKGLYSPRKDGSQLGANTYLRLFPGMKLAIVVLANRRISEPGLLSYQIASAILPTLPPVLTLQPMSGTVHVGDSINLVINAVSSESLEYQWYKDGVEIPGATSPTLYLPATDRGAAGLYSVVVTNSAGQAISSNATIRVLAPLLVEPLGTLPGGGFQLQFGDQDGHPLEEADKDYFTAEWSSDLQSWSAVENPILTLVEGKFVLDDPGAAGTPYRYYRIQQD